MAFRYDKPYRTLINIDNQKISELFNLVYQMDTQELMQFSLINKVPLSVQLPNGNNLIHEVLLNNDKLKNEFNRLNVIKFLVHNEVNPDEPNRDNQTPIHIACQKQYKEISDFLINDCSVDLKYKDNNGFTALHYLLIGDISLFEKKETTDLISFQRKGDIDKKDEILKIKKEIYNKIKDEPFLKSLEKTIYDTLKNSSEINDTILEIEDKINKRVKSTDPVNQLKENKELIEIQKNKMKGIIGGLWGKFADSSKLKLHTPTIDSLTIENEDIGIIENANLKKELKGEINKNVDEFSKYIHEILTNDDNHFSEFDFDDTIEKIYQQFVNSSNNISKANTPLVYNNGTKFVDEDLGLFTDINKAELHEDARDFADNIINLNLKDFIGGSRNLEIYNDYNFDYNELKNLFDKEKDSDIKFKKLFLFLILNQFIDTTKYNCNIQINRISFVDVNDLKNNIDAENDVDNFINNRLNNTLVQKYIIKYIHYIKNPDYALEIYCEYTKLCCYFDTIIDMNNNLVGYTNNLVMNFMSCLMNKQYTFENYIANFTFSIMYADGINKGIDFDNITDKQKTIFLQEMFLKFIYPLKDYKANSSLPESEFKKTIEKILINIEETLNNKQNYKTELEQMIENLFILFNTGYIKIPEIMLCDFIYIVKKFINYRLFFEFPYLIDLLESHTFLKCKLDQLVLEKKTRQLYAASINDLPPSFQGIFYFILEIGDLNANLPTDATLITFYANKFLESIHLKLYYQGTLNQFINDDQLYNGGQYEVNVKLPGNKKAVEKKLSLPENYDNLTNTIIDDKIPLPFNYIYPSNGNNIDKTTIPNIENNNMGPVFQNIYPDNCNRLHIYNEYQYRPPTKISHIKLLTRQYNEIFRLLQNIFLSDPNSFNILFSSIKSGKIRDISKYYLCYYFICKNLINIQSYLLEYKISNLDDQIKQIKKFDLNKLNDFLNKTNGYIFLYYYLFSKSKTNEIKIPKFSFYKIEADKFYYLDSPLNSNFELSLEIDKEIKINDRKNYIDIKDIQKSKDAIRVNYFKRNLANLLLDKSILDNKQYHQDKSDELPPSVESILGKFFEYNKIILFKSINKNVSNYTNILDDIVKILEKTNLSVLNIESQKQFYLFQLIQEIIKDQSELYTNKAINKRLIELSRKEGPVKNWGEALKIFDSISKIKNIDNTTQFNDIGEFTNTNINFVIETDDFYDNYYIFKNENTLDECKFIIYPNEYSNTYTLKQMYCLKINQVLLEKLINTDSDPYVIDEYGNSIISPLEKTYHHQSLETLRKNDIDLYRYNIPRNPFDNLKLEDLNHITKIIKGVNYNEYISNFVSSQYNEIKVILLANNRFGYNIINYLDTSFKTCFYIINEYLTDILWRYNNDYKHIDLQAIISITGNSENNIRLNYLFGKINSLNIPESNQVIILKDYLDKINQQIKFFEDKITRVRLEERESNKKLQAKINKINIDLRKLLTTRNEIIRTIYLRPNYDRSNKSKQKIIKTYQKIDDSGIYLKCWDELFKKNDYLEKSWNLDLIKILLKEQDLLKVKDLEPHIKEYKIINKFYKQLELLSKIYFEGSNFISSNKVKKFVFELLEHLTGSFICYNIEMLLRNLLMKYFVDTSVNSYAENNVDQFTDINDKINYLLDSRNVIKDKSFKDILYKDLPKEFVRNSVDLFENYEDKQLFESKSIKEILNDLFNLLTVGEVISVPSNSQFMQILNRDLTDYFDLFIQKLINNWLVVIENTFKFSINQYRINKCILELAKP
jgi:hypothetical protein